MKTKRLLILPALLMLMISGCQSKQKSSEAPIKAHGAEIFIDTIKIKGVAHEFMVNDTPYSNQIFHSPECWCGKEKKGMREVDWEQRRYEIAKDVLSAFLSDGDGTYYKWSMSDQTVRAVDYADMLIKELKRKEQ